ncbi:MAG: DUF3999 family protein, partial [Chloroflexi bacterium]|nr:DUF3999 family protein [Chloroflexota bacterium]
GSAPGLLDLRIIGTDNRETPYKLEIRRGTKEQRDVPVAIRDQGYVQGEYNTFIADLSRDGVLHNRIEFQTTSINFQRTAVVETSNDLTTWAVVAEGIVHDFRLMDTVGMSRNTAMAYPDSTARYVRVRVLDDGNGSLAITGAHVFAVQEEARREVLWPVAITDISPGSNEGTAQVELDLCHDGIPTDRLSVTVDDVNFDRDVTLEASDDGETWRTVQSRASIFAYDTPRFTGENLSFTYPETTTRYLRLVIHDADSPPLTVTDVQVWGVERRVLFFAKPGEAYKVYYGNADALRPTYDIDRLLGFLDTTDLPMASLGAQMDNPQYVEKLEPFTERFPWLLPLVLALAGLLVGGILLSVVRQARKALPPQE